MRRIEAQPNHLPLHAVQCTGWHQSVTHGESYQVSEVADALALGRHVSDVLLASKRLVDGGPSGRVGHSANVLDR